ncbi:MAG: DUF1488 family protein [Burkholderiales bacterium]|nr:DUF1488 family protein [Burkholderiales bacterium]
MAGVVTISNPLVESMDGITFTGVRDGVTQTFLVSREALEDLEYESFTNGALMLAAFGRLQQQVADGAGRALDAGEGGPKTVLLRTLLF